MAKKTVEEAAGKYRLAKKGLTKHDREPTPAEHTRIEGQLAKAEKDLVAAVGVLIGMKLLGRGKA